MDATTTWSSLPAEVHIMIRALIPDPLTRALLAMTCRDEARRRRRLVLPYPVVSIWNRDRARNATVVAAARHRYNCLLFRYGPHDLCAHHLIQHLPLNRHEIIPQAIAHGSIAMWRAVLANVAVRNRLRLSLMMPVRAHSPPAYKDLRRCRITGMLLKLMEHYDPYEKFLPPRI